MRRVIAKLLGGRLQPVLVAGFSLIAALTVGLNALFSSRLIKDYLADAEDERVARDMDLAQAFYQLKLEEVAAISHRLVLDSWVNQYLALAEQGQEQAVAIIDQQITNKITVLALGGTHCILVLDAQGDILVGRTLDDRGELSPILSHGNWSGLPILQHALATGQETSSTEVIPVEFLDQVGLAEQAAIQLRDTPRAAPAPFDPREGSAGLALTGVSLIPSEDGGLRGAVLTAYLFNKDYTLVDRIKQVAGVDTVTIFFGDLRVSTNVMTEAGERAVGTRVSQAVNDVVLEQGQDYVGRAFVVNEWFITRYIPLKNYANQVVGSLYVGARVSAFENLVDNFNTQMIVIALVSVLLAAVIAVPMSRIITLPIQKLVDANQRLALGDMSVRVEPYGEGELALLGRSFNSMVETLHNTQQELLHKERLASMGQLAAGVAHEINNPLGTILLYSDVMRKEVTPDSPQQEDLDRIIAEVTRCKRIVADLLNFARQQQVVSQPTDLNELIESVIENTSLQPSYEGVEIVRRFAPNLPIITADPSQMRQVFANLLNNAAEAIPREGTITITTCALDAHTVQVIVSDTGTGIPQESLGKIFTPFFTTKPLGHGTGLGLSIVYGIIKMHRGQISVSSQPGEGSAFTITLPVHLPDVQANQALAAEIIG